MARTSSRGGPQTRARIAESANRLMLERGFEAVTVAEVARAADVSSVTVFNHFPRKEDLFLDRVPDAAELIRSAIRDRDQGSDPISALGAAAARLVESRAPLSGLDPRSVPFFRTVAGSPALRARAREIASELETILVEELEADPSFTGDAGLLAALVLAGWRRILVDVGVRLLAGESHAAVGADQPARVAALFTGLREGGFGSGPAASSRGR